MLKILGRAPAIKRSEDLAKLMPLLAGRPYLPMSASGLGADELVLLLNEIIINRRRSILEFGSGISTILMARLARINDLSALRIYSVDDDRAWGDLVADLLETEGLREFVKSVYAPLTSCEFGINGLKWYDLTKLAEELGEQRFDMILVDGPRAYTKDLRYSRYPALPFVLQRTSSRFGMFLDDTNRPGEQAILNLWRDRFRYRFSQATERMAMLHVGEAFNAL